MNPFNLKDDIFIQSFERYSEVYDKALQLGGEQNIIFKGKVKDVTEEIAKEYVIHDIHRCKYKNYNPETFKPDGIKFQGFNYAVISIQSAIEQNHNYCIIYRKPKYTIIIDKATKIENNELYQKQSEGRLNRVSTQPIIINMVDETQPKFEPPKFEPKPFSSQSSHFDESKKNKEKRKERKQQKSNMFDSRSECGKSKIRKMR